MAESAHLGLRAKLSAIVVVVVLLVMLPFVLAGVAFLDRQGREEAERELGTIDALVHDLVDSHRAAGGDLDGLRRRLSGFAIGDSGYVFIIDANPGANYGHFIVHPDRGAADALHAGDVLSRAVVGRMLAQREGVLSYAWRNPELGEEQARRKLAVFRIHEELGWLIGASGYEDEFNRTSIASRNGMVVAVVVMAALLVLALNLAIGGLVIEPMLRLQRILRTLSRGNETLVHAEDEAGLVDGICRVLVESGRFRFARIALFDGLAVRDVAAAGRAADFCRALAAQGAEDEDPARLAISVRRLVHLADPTDAGKGLWAAARAAGCSALIAFPLMDGERLLGALCIGAASPADLDAAGVALLRELAEDLAFGIASQRTVQARRLAEAALHLRERALESSSDGVLIVDLHGDEARLIYANPAVERLTGQSHEALAGAPLSALSSIDAAGRAELHAALAARRDTVLELTGRHADGSGFWCECSLARVGEADADGDGYVVGVLKDVTERTLYLRQIEHQAKYDALTGLPNRSLMGDRLEQAIHVAHRHGSALAVAVVDLDHFKLVNDNLGHTQGDVLLREAARRIAGALREGDTAARQGGDEFVVLLPDLIGEQDGYPVLRRVQQALAEPILIDGRGFYVTCSIGVSLYPRDGDDAETLLRNADMAMYRAKEAGRDAISFFTAEMDRQMQDRLDIEQELRHALERGELHLVYQPQVDADSGRVCGAEALLRWRHPRLGQVAPLRFIPLAEELGLIGPIGEWVLREACAQAQRWRAQGLGELRIAVNVSARQFREPDLPGRVVAILAETGLPPRLLELELTESMLMGAVGRTEETLRRLKQIGVELALDDFGTGYSSFAYLRRFPIDTLKIDQSFVRDMEDGSNAASIVAAIIAMAHSLHMRVIAEGVESVEQQRQLYEHGCDQMQGYLFGRPLPTDEFAELATAGGR
ncbi:EAL domain-containing protein [Thauera sp. CAU 1555]|uniref:EAL domain-containing protein n=1 Tax=Thauera sedimentorum TaxID=2767595 RepID=A0ABR9BB98_9RHOO|nr:EAL domain-containing protein [Thauera sedimentorum]MBC9072661.1 EAL domain-containing protein [Thauera sedimentorum]MBD8503580.1 EAL domain-containing protein [Thauera sedimentorum]